MPLCFAESETNAIQLSINWPSIRCSTAECSTVVAHAVARKNVKLHDNISTSNVQLWEWFRFRRKKCQINVRWSIARKKIFKKVTNHRRGEKLCVTKKKLWANDSTGYTLVEPRHIRVPFVYRHYTHAPDHGITRHNKPQRPPDNGHNTA